MANTSPAPSTTNTITSIAITTRPPVTTPFTLPASCLQDTYTLPPNGSDRFNISTTYLADIQGGVTSTINNVFRGLSSQCWPSGSAGDSLLTSWSGPCPTDYSTVVVTYADTFAYNTCCPSQFSVVEGVCQREFGNVFVVNGSQTLTFGDITHEITQYATPVTAWIST